MASFMFATVAYAAVSTFNPSSGTVSPGGTTGASFTVTPPPLLTSCITASVSPGPLQFTVVFDGLGLGALPANCATLEPTDVEMTVTAGANATPGQYEVTITEVALLGGQLIATREWPFEVVAPPTTTSSTTSTSTSSTSTTSTSTPGVTTTSTPRPSTTIGQATTTTASATTSSRSGVVTTEGSGTPAANGGLPTSTPRPGSSPSSLPDPSATHDVSDDGGDDVFALPPPSDLTGGPPDRGGATPADGGEFLSKISLSEQLRNQISRALPLPVAQAVLSPLVIVEFLFRSALASAFGYLIPLLLAALYGTWMVVRMRREVDDDELAFSTET